MLTRSQAEFLKKEAARREITVSDLLRRIIDEYRDMIAIRSNPAVVTWPKRPDGSNMEMGEWNDKKEK
jgi:hypothetical protein